VAYYALWGVDQRGNFYPITRGPYFAVCEGNVQEGFSLRDARLGIDDSRPGDKAFITLGWEKGLKALYQFIRTKEATQYSKIVYFFVIDGTGIQGSVSREELLA
jgi:hypothetical protein